jgi:Zn-dependent protease with chaperone function
MARELKIEIGLEQEIAALLYQALQGDVVRFVIKNADDSLEDDLWRSRMEGHCMKVDKKLLGNFYALCQEVKETLGFEEPVDFYVTGDSSINAFSISSAEEGRPHIVNVNSELFKLMSEDELRFVVGHELGHLINRDTELKRLINFVYPPDKPQIPLALNYKIHLHDNLAELVADRFGLWACGNLEASVSAFYKMKSGLDLKSMQVSIADLLEDNTKHLEYFKTGGGLSLYDHPVDPIRVEAIRLFATARSQAALDRGMNELISILLRLGNGPLDYHLTYFYATAGLIAANADGKMTAEEQAHIINTLSRTHFFPKDFFKHIQKQDVKQVFEESITNLLKIDQGIKPELVAYMIRTVMADKTIGEDEVNFVYNFGQSLGMSIKEISNVFADMFQMFFNPSLASIA